MVQTTQRSYLGHDYSFKSWLLTGDHKRVAILYFVSILLFFVLGGIAATLLRLELLTPSSTLIQPDTYKKIYTMHGMLMIFFGLTPAVPAILGNFLVPLMIGAKNLAFPKLNLAGWYLFSLGGLLLLAAIVLGGVDTGWVFYATYSTSEPLPLALTGLAIVLVAVSSILLAINYVITIHRMRAPGLTWFRLPLFVWTIQAVSLISLVAMPILIVTVVLALLENWIHLGIFDPRFGGDPLIFQYLFWFYGHQTAYLIILPAIGIAFEIFAAFARRPIFGYRIAVYSILSLIGLGFASWTIHMANDLSTYAAIVSSFFSFLTIIPFSLILLSLAATLIKGDIIFRSPLLFVLGGIGLFLIGGPAGIMLSTLTLAKHLTGTTFVTAHMHFAIGAAVMAFLGGLHFWWPKLTGRIASEGLAKATAIIFFVAINLALLTQFVLGYLGMSRHTPWYPTEFSVWQVASSLGTTILVAAYILPVLYLVWSLFAGPKATANPWRAKGLEWEQASSPPLAGNFTETPLVTEEAYAYPGSSAGPAQRPGDTPASAAL